MSSIIEGYNYDIFISYRQKDNKHDGWVTEFVNQLKGELESTFKEEISVYFDINPHDGLLETHDVDASLKDKLKCLVFIPIISRTYCDPRSFAWEHELKAFIEQASKDQVGLKVRLPNGNVANRVLPVKIHDLDAEDARLCESVIGGVRGIEFIYKEPGANKPLTADDDEKKNLNNTKYRIQINKVALAIKEIILGLKSFTKTKATDKSIIESEEAPSEESARIKVKNGLSGISLKKWLLISFILFFCIAGTLAIYKVINHGKQSQNLSKSVKSIAVLPFEIESPDKDKDNEYFSWMNDEIVNQLAEIRNLRVMFIPKTQKYRNIDENIRLARQELGVSYAVCGWIKKVGSDLRLTAWLIETHPYNILWQESYDGKDPETGLKFQSSIAERIVKSVIATMNSQPDTAFDWIREGQRLCDTNKYEEALKAFEKVTSLDSTRIDALRWQGWVLLELDRYEEAMLKYNKAVRLDPDFAGNIYDRGCAYCRKGDKAKALADLKKAITLEPNFKLHATRDTDFKSLWEDEDFIKLTSQ